MNGHRTLLHHVEVEPPAGLRDAVRCLWYDRLDGGDMPADFTILPDGYAEIVFHTGSVRTAQAGALPSPFIMGLLDRPVLLRAQGRLDIIGIRCFPWTVFDLLGLAPGEGPVHVFSHPICQLQPLLADCLRAGRIDEAFTLLRGWLLAHPAQLAVDGRLRKAGAALLGAGGAVPVSEVALAAHASVRTLERKFKASSGHTVKDVAGLMRFEGVRNRLWLHPAESIAALAEEFGYTDQAHLSREFKRYSGTTPAAFARRARTG